MKKTLALASGRVSGTLSITDDAGTQIVALIRGVGGD
jgi:hypothetical protein